MGYCPFRVLCRDREPSSRQSLSPDRACSRGESFLARVTRPCARDTALHALPGVPTPATKCSRCRQEDSIKTENALSVATGPRTRSGLCAQHPCTRRERNITRRHCLACTHVRERNTALGALLCARRQFLSRQSFPCRGRAV